MNKTGFESLDNEIQCIESVYKFTSILDSLEYIKRNFDEGYRGTKCGREFQEFCRIGAIMFESVNSTKE
jgi:hypothetical protein